MEQRFVDIIREEIENVFEVEVVKKKKGKKKKDSIPYNLEIGRAHV